MQSGENKYDVIIIGSGMSALTSASLLAQLWKKRVLVLERHFKPGGFTHVFKRNAEKTYEWDVGLHYVGGMSEDEPTRAIFDYISQGGVRWNKMKDPYDVFIYPDQRVELPSGEENFIATLTKIFPGQETAIRHYVKDIKKAGSWFGRQSISRNLPRLLKPLGMILSVYGKKSGLMTTKAYLKNRISDEKLRAILVSQWGNYGLPPEKSAFALHAVIAAHYLNGGYYPKGGAKQIADNIIPVIEMSGGQVLVNHEVSEIIVEGNRARGVKVRHHKKKESPVEKEYYADSIISAAGAFTTYHQLIPPAFAPPFVKDLESFPAGTANVTLYLGLKDDPQKIGYYGENLWLYSSYDHDQVYRERNKLSDCQPGACYVSCPSAKNPDATAHTMEIISFIDHSVFQEWAEMPWKNRGAKYELLKETITENIISFVESRLPGLRGLIDYKELSTPLSTRHFTGHRAGEIYGLPGIPQKFEVDWLKIKSPIKNLYLTGSDVAIHGIVGAMMSGVITTGIMMGMPFSIMKIFKSAIKYNKFIQNY